MDSDTENTPPMPSLRPEVVEDVLDDYTGVPPLEEDPEVKSLDRVAREVLRGEWGYGQERRKALADAGFDPNAVKAEMVRVANSRS